jgi:hypothetical protein
VKSESLNLSAVEVRFDLGDTGFGRLVHRLGFLELHQCAVAILLDNLLATPLFVASARQLSLKFLSKPSSKPRFVLLHALQASIRATPTVKVKRIG